MAERSPSATPRGWRDAATSRPRQGRSLFSRRIASVGLVLAMLTGIGAVAGLAWILWPSPSPRFVALWVDHYEDPRIPTDPSSVRDYRSLSELVELPEVPPGLDRDWGKELSGLARNEGVIVYLSAHARLGPKGEVRILRSDAQLGRLEREPTLRDVLAALKACPSRDKLLILDIMRPHADASIGVLDDDVARRIPSELEAVPDEGRTVLCAASAGQRSLASETLGRSVFNYYVDQGLRGEADKAGPDPDDTVTVGELADYVKARTSGWAWSNRKARQVPLLVSGQEKDFRLFRPDPSTKAELALPEEDEKKKPVYPPWLADAWKRRGAWWDDGSYRVAPRLFRRWEAALLRAEREWRMGADPQRVWDGLQSEFRTLTQEVPKAGSLPSLQRLDPRYRPAGPEPPRSVGLAEDLGREPDRALAASVLAWLMEIRNAPPDAKADAPPDPAAAVKAFLAANKETIDRDASGFALAWAVLDAAAKPPDRDLPDLPDRLRLLTPLIERRPRPLTERYVEMLLLADLAARGGGDGPSSRPASTLQQAVEVLRIAERADGRPGSFPWVHHLLDPAGRERHVAEILLRSSGYASDAEVGSSLDRAGRLYENIEAAQRTIAETRLRLDQALAILPPYLAYRETSRGPTGTSDAWGEAVDEARRGFTLLEQPAEGLTGRIGDLQQVSGRLAELLDALMRPFGKESVAELVKKAQRTSDPEVYVEIDAVLRAPFVAAEDRARLWAAARGLGRKLHQGTDRPLEEGTDGAAVGGDRRVADRARWSLGLLALGGGEGDELARPYADYESKPGPATEAPLVRAIREAWIVRLPGRLDQAISADGPGRLHSLRAADRLSRIVPPAQRSEVLDRPETNPTVRSAAAEAVELWSWLARRHQYEARVFEGLISGTHLFEEAADAFGRLAGAATGEATLRLDAPGPGIPSLDAERPGAETTVQLTLEASPDAREEKADLRVLSPDSRLQVEPRELTRALKPGEPASVKLKLTFKEGGAAAPSRAEGVLVLATLNGRAYPLKLAVGEGLGAAAPVPILSASPEAPGPPLKEILVRPLMAPQKLYLYVRNPSDRPRVVKIQVLAGGAGVPGGTAEVSIGPEKTERVRKFGEPAAAPAAALPPGGANADTPGQPAGPAAGLVELAAEGAITLRLSFDGKPPLETTVPVRLASPADYIEVADALFEPAGANPDDKNELSVRVKARGAALDPPCAIHLVVSRVGIPGLLDDAEQAEDRIKVGSESGEGKRAFVSDLRLEVGNEPHGVFYLDVDDFDRAMKFGVNFLNEGPPQVPREDRVPAIRRMLAEGGPFPDAPLPVLAGPPLPVTVEVDNAPADSKLELSLGIPQGVGANPRVVEGAAKREYLGLAADPGGALVFQGAVKDREFQLETVGLRGRRRLSARLLDSNGVELDSMTRDVIFDDRPPERLRFIGLPPGPIGPGTKFLDLKAEGFTPVGIKSVVFFLGEPQDGKRPEGLKPIPARPENGQRTLWGGRIPLPGDPGPDPQAISVEFVSNIGKSEFRTVHVGFQAPPPPPKPPDDAAKGGAAKKKDEPTTGTIAGTLKEGPRPQRQITVVLYEYDPQGKPKENARTKTDDAGKFSFKEVKPGKYALTAAKPESRTRAVEQVEVEAGKVVAADLKLSR